MGVAAGIVVCQICRLQDESKRSKKKQGFTGRQILVSVYVGQKVNEQQT